MPVRRSNFAWGFGGVFWGLFIALGGLAVAGAGHGWVSAWPFGLLAIFTTPLVTVAWARRETDGKRLAARALVVGLVADFTLVVATINEGMVYVLKPRVRDAAVVWIIAWCSWQVLAVAILVHRPTRDHK